MRSSVLLLFFSLAVHFAPISSAALSCMDPSGNPVVWWFLIKYPANLTTDAPRYSYIDSTSTKGSFQILTGLPDSPNGPLDNTFSAINQVSSTNINLLLWNDEVPDEGIQEHEGTAHSKGVLGFDNSTNQGVYVLHSAPKYPSISEEAVIDYVMPENTDTYAQHFYCMTLSQVNFNLVVPHLKVIDPTIYWTSGVFKGMNINSTQLVEIDELTLSNGDFHWFFSKNANYFPYIYEGIVQPFLGLGLQVESWGRPYLNSFCPPQVNEPVVNVNQVSFPGTNITWNHFEDHSKWAITTGSPTTEYACLCDMNRMETQNNRGGSCACTTNQILYEALVSIISQYDEC